MNEITKKERTAQDIAVEINIIKQQTLQTVAAASFQIGKRLCEAKAIVPAGEWLTYLQEQLDYKSSTAENLMRIYREYGSEQVDLMTGKSPAEIFSGLSQSQMVAMFALEPSERAELVQNTPGIESMSSRQIADLTKELKTAKEEAARLRKMRETADKIAVSKAKEVRELESQAHGNEQRIEELQQELQKARDDLEQAQGQQTIIQEQEVDVSAYEKRIEELELKLKEAEAKPIEVVSEPVSEEKMREEREKIREEFQRKVELTEVNVLFRQLQETAEKLRIAVEGCTAEQQNKMRNAVASTLRTLASELEGGD